MNKKITPKRVRVIIGCILLLLLPRLMPNSYFQRIINMMGIYVIMATGVNILTGYTGQLSLGQAAFFDIGAYTSAILNTRFGWPLYLTFPCSIVITALFGLVLAIPALKVSGSYLAIMTIGFCQIVRLVLVNWVELTRGPSGITGIAAINLFGHKLTNVGEYYYLVLLFAVAGILYQNLLIRSRTGRALMAIREDSKAAMLTGINVSKYKIMAFVVASIYTAIAGFLYAHMVRYISPDTFSSNTSNIILWSAIIGGIGTPAGPIIGGIVMQLLPELLRPLGDFRMVIYGVMLLLIIIFTPWGISPYLTKLRDACAALLNQKLLGRERK